MDWPSELTEAEHEINSGALWKESFIHRPCINMGWCVGQKIRELGHELGQPSCGHRFKSCFQQSSHTLVGSMSKTLNLLSNARTKVSAKVT